MSNILFDFISQMDCVPENNIDMPKDIMSYMDMKEKSKNNPKLTNFGYLINILLKNDINMSECVSWIAFYFQYPESRFGADDIGRERDWIAMKYKNQGLVNDLYEKIFGKKFGEIGAKYYIPSILQTLIRKTEYEELSKNIWVMNNPFIGDTKKLKIEKKFPFSRDNSNLLGTGVCYFELEEKEILIYWCGSDSRNIKECKSKELTNECSLDCSPKVYRLHKILGKSPQETYDKYINFCTELLNKKPFRKSQCYVRIPLFWDFDRKYVTETYFSVTKSSDLFLKNIPKIFSVLYTIMGLINNKFSYFIGNKLGEKQKNINVIRNSFVEKNNFVGQSKEINAFKTLVSNISKMNISLTISGEYGTGKSFTAKQIHMLSPRKRYPLVTLYNKNFKESMLEMEKGTIIINEMSRLDLEQQEILLRFIEGPFYKKNNDLVVILISDNSLNKGKGIESVKVMNEIINSLGGFMIKCPAIRERDKDDVIEFCNYFIKSYCSLNNIKIVPKISDEARQVMQQYDWPGNIKEIRSFMFSAISSCKNNFIEIEDLPKINLNEDKDFICTLTQTKISIETARKAYNYIRLIEKGKKDKIKSSFLFPNKKKKQDEAVDKGIAITDSFGWSVLLFWYYMYWEKKLEKNILLKKTRKIFDVNSYGSIWSKVRDYVKISDTYQHKNLRLTAKMINKESAYKFNKWFKNYIK